MKENKNQKSVLMDVVRSSVKVFVILIKTGFRELQKAFKNTKV